MRVGERRIEGRGLFRFDPSRPILCARFPPHPSPTPTRSLRRTHLSRISPASFMSSSFLALRDAKKDDSSRSGAPPPPESRPSDDAPIATREGRRAHRQESRLYSSRNAADEWNAGIELPREAVAAKATVAIAMMGAMTHNS